MPWRMRKALPWLFASEQAVGSAAAEALPRVVQVPARAVLSAKRPGALHRQQIAGPPGVAAAAFQVSSVLSQCVVGVAARRGSFPVLRTNTKHERGRAERAGGGGAKTQGPNIVTKLGFESITKKPNNTHRALLPPPVQIHCVERGDRPDPARPARTRTQPRTRAHTHCHLQSGVSSLPRRQLARRPPNSPTSVPVQSQPSRSSSTALKSR